MGKKLKKVRKPMKLPANDRLAGDATRDDDAMSNEDRAFARDECEGDSPPPVTWITDRVAIGNYLAAQDRLLLCQEGIASVISLDGTLRGRKPEELGLREIEVFLFEDGPGNDPRVFRLAVDALKRCVDEHPRVLVHCHAGRSRSVVVVAGYLVATLGLAPEEAFDRVRALRPTYVSPGLEQLLDFL